MEQTLEQRCKVALECLPDARYRTMLGGLFDELLARAAVPPSLVQQPQEFVAWMADDGRVVPAATMATALRDGGASASALRPYHIPLVAMSYAAGVTAAHPLHMPTDEQFRFMRVPQHENYACEKAAIRLFCRLNGITRRLNAQCTAASAECASTQHSITDMLVAHRDMIEAQQRGDSAAEVLAVQRMEAARSALADARPGEEQLEPFWCHEQSHDRPRCETQCAECAEDGVAEPSGEELSQAPSLDEILAVVLLYAKNPTPHNEYKVRCALRDALNPERQPQVRALMARAWEEGADAMERAAIDVVRRRHAQQHADFEAGWRTAANWMDRDDLIADIGSQAYLDDRAKALAASGVPASAPEPCPRGADRPEPSCTNRHQCWEPCGELGHSAEHARIAGVLPLEVPSQHTDPSKWPSKADIDRADPRCKGCDLPNGHPEYCRCTPGVKTVDGGQHG